MRKLWIWLTVLLVTVVLIAWRGQPSLRLPISLFQSPVRVDPLDADRSASQPVQPPILATVNADRLLTDLTALTFIRYADPERQQARDYIQQTLKASGWTTQFHPFSGGINLYAEKPGTDPGAATILLGAHYDTVEGSPGADDNATSVATLLEVARLLGRQTFARTLQLVFFDLEERGLLGSQAFVSQKVNPATLQAAVILDMVGYACQEAGCQSYPSVLPIRPPTDRGNFLAALGDQSHPQILDSFTFPQSPSLPPVLTLAIPTFGGLAPDLVRSDHAPFWKKGIGAVLITDTANFRNPHYHQASDTLETIDQTFWVGAAQIVVNAVAYLLQN